MEYATENLHVTNELYFILLNDKKAFKKLILGFKFQIVNLIKLKQMG